MLLGHSTSQVIYVVKTIPRLWHIYSIILRYYTHASFFLLSRLVKMRFYDCTTMLFSLQYIFDYFCLLREGRMDLGP